MRRVLVAALFAGALPAQEPSAAVTLSDPLQSWKREIEALGDRQVVLARIHTDRARNLLILPQDAGHRPVLRRYLMDRSFVAELIATHALTLNYTGPEGSIHFVLLNMNRAGEWKGAEDALLGHEFGHVWLSARGYELPPYEAGPRACVRIHAGDIVQHILIREEMRRREIAYLRYWIPNLEKALEQLEAPGEQPPKPPCMRLANLALWVDVKLGAEPWDGRQRFLEAMERRYPDLKEIAEQLASRLSEQQVSEPEVYRRELTHVLARLESLAEAWFSSP